MKLQIKDDKTEDTKIIELERYVYVVSVKIGGEIVAQFWDNGNFYFYGKDKTKAIYKGRWDITNNSRFLSRRQMQFFHKLHKIFKEYNLDLSEILYLLETAIEALKEINKNKQTKHLEKKQ